MSALTASQVQAARRKREGFCDTDPADFTAKLAELTDSKAGMQLMALLAECQDVFIAKARSDNSRKSRFEYVPPQTAEQRLADRILDHFGPPEDCWLLREMARDLVEADRDAADARRA